MLFVQSPVLHRASSHIAFKNHMGRAASSYRAKQHRIWGPSQAQILLLNPMTSREMWLHSRLLDQHKGMGVSQKEEGGCVQCCR